MGKKAPKPPTPIDPNVISNAQSGANINTAQTQQRLNMVNSSGPTGAVNWTADAGAPGGYRSTVSLDPQIQGLVSGLEGDLAGGTRGVSDALYGQATSRLDPQFAQDENALRVRLANQGLTPGAPAYDRAYANFTRGKNDAYNQANFSAISGGEAARSGRVSDLQGLFSLAPQAQYAPVGVAPTDVTGAYGLNAQMQNNAYNAQAANYQSSLGGLYALGSAALGANKKPWFLP